MLGLIISLQGLAVIAFLFGAFNASEHSLACLLQCLCPLNQWESFFGLSVLSAVSSELVGMITLIKIRFPDKSSVFSRWFLSL